MALACCWACMNGDGTIVFDGELGKMMIPSDPMYMCSGSFKYYAHRSTSRLSQLHCIKLE